MFRKIQCEDLIPGTKYKIGTEFTGHYEKMSYIYIGQIPELFVEFKNMKKNNLRNWRRFVSTHCDFYEFVTQHPQWNMERRSVNLIVRRLIGDDNFEW